MTPPGPTPPGRTPPRTNTLRGQFTLVIFLLAFLPNAVLTVGAGAQLGLGTGVTLPLALWLLTVALLSGLIGWVLSGALLRPLSRLTTQLGRGEFERGVGEGHDDPQEVRALRAAFGGLLARLGTEQGRRSAFMATLVHDLKTPLIATSHLIRILASRPLPQLERSALGEHLLTENARLLALVQQMADAHRFEREDVRLSLTRTELRPLLSRVAARLQQQAAERGVSVLVEGGGEAEVDAAVLERGLSNLADNALRYARSEVRLAAHAGGLSVSDDGPGLNEEATIETLAQPFNAQPVEIAGQRYTAGTAGLGLYIVRRIAEAHGGRLSYHRQEGLTTMRLELPDSSPSARSTRAQLFFQRPADMPASVISSLSPPWPCGQPSSLSPSPTLPSSHRPEVKL